MSLKAFAPVTLWYHEMVLYLVCNNAPLVWGKDASWTRGQASSRNLSCSGCLLLNFLGNNETVAFGGTTTCHSWRNLKRKEKPSEKWYKKSSLNYCMKACCIVAVAFAISCLCICELGAVLTGGDMWRGRACLLSKTSDKLSFSFFSMWKTKPHAWSQT